MHRTGASACRRTNCGNFRNHFATFGIDTGWRNRRGTPMQCGYPQPFSFQIGSRPEPKPEPKVVSVRHGVTEITLDDGRLVRATLHIKSITTDPNKPGSHDNAKK